MSGTHVAGLVAQIEHMDLEAVRGLWEKRYGDAPPAAVGSDHADGAGMAHSGR